MLKLLKEATNVALTENNEVTNLTTGSDCVDLFATIGALRNAGDKEIITRFEKAFAENPELAVRMLFFARDIREGLGERRVFMLLINYLATNNASIVRKNLQIIPEYGRYDDLLCLLDTPCEKDALELIKKIIAEDVQNLDNGEEVSLLAKWLPSINASSEKTIKNAKKVAKFLGMELKQYRTMLTRLREKIKIIENNLRVKDYTFDYSKQPSLAMLKYRKAFLRNDEERYMNFLKNAVSGKVKMNTSTLTPYDIVRNCFDARSVFLGFESKQITEEETKSLDSAWRNLEKLNDNSNTLVVVDVSGSMYLYSGTPASVAMSLGIYFAENNTGVFANHFITFSNNPRLIEIKGNNIVEKVKYIQGYDEGACTNVEAVYNLILNTAIKNKVSKNEMPSRLIFISDMEFDSCAENASISNFENAKKKFKDANYDLPEIVFWNVASRNRHQPVTKNEQGVALVSGSSANVFKMVMNKELNPFKIMCDTLNSERYAQITI